MGRRADPLAALRQLAPLSAATTRKNLAQLVQLRWIAAVGQLTTIGVVEHGLGIDLPLTQMGVVIGAFMAVNALCVLRLRWRRKVTRIELFAGLGFDALVLTALLYLSGGATNPFTSLYLLQVILGAVLLEAWAVWAMVGITALCFLQLTTTYRPLLLPPGADLFDLYMRGAAVGFVLDAVLLVVFISRINANLRMRDERLAALRQRAAEEDHIVRMGLLASGAAHELGTPLATLDVILGDWRRMPKLAADPELSQEVEEMRAEVARCKSIVTSVLISAGEARGEAAGVSSLKGYLARIFAEWRARRRPSKAAAYRDELSADPAIVADSALKQAISNLLDNAYEASPRGVALIARLKDDILEICIQDEGPGFTPQMLAELGKLYQSTKGRLGGGLGLFLVINVVRKLGGRVDARNRAGGGAEVILSVPLSALAIEDAE